MILVGITSIALPIKGIIIAEITKETVVILEKTIEASASSERTPVLT